MSTMREILKLDGRTLSVLALVLSLTPGCITEPDSMDNDSTNTIVQILRMAAQSTDAGGQGEITSDLLSDVCFSQTSDDCSVFNDNGVVTMVAFPKDRTQLTSGDEGTSVNSVQFERYRVTYIRADGRNTAGVDVPYPFDGAVNFLVAANGAEVERGFIVVRHQAKVESPLRELQLNISGILSVIAQIDFFGHDGAGRAVRVTGYLNITFADFAN